MKTTLVPGYPEIFGEQTGETYEAVVRMLPSDLIIRLCIILNGELNTPAGSELTQQRLVRLVSRRFTNQQNNQLNQGFERYRRKTGGHYQSFVFGRRYLMAMLIKELNHFRPYEGHDDQSALQEFYFFKAYLMVIDEVNWHDNELFKGGKLDKKDPDSAYKLLWTANINQFEFSEHTNVVYETFKLMGVFAYALKKLLPYLKTYLNGLGFKTLGELLSSLNQIATSAEKYYPDEVFKMLTYIAPDENIDQTHLKAQTIVPRTAQEKPLTLFDIKKFPLYHYPARGYMVIDGDIYKKKTYLGPFFELCKNTELEKEKGFVAYSGEIAFEVLEQSCLQTVLKMLRDRHKGFLHFDDGTDSVPDGYYRADSDIFLFEFKAHLFPFNLSSEPEFEKVKAFIDTRFVKNEKKKAKGIGQLKQQIAYLDDGTFGFDTGLKKQKAKKKIRIYPIICHTEFHFGLPGINKYLDDLFQASLDDKLKAQYDIRPLTVINLEVLFDFGVRVHHYKDLKALIDRYHKILGDRTSKLSTRPVTQESYWRAHMSFDEMYHSVFIAGINRAPQHRHSFSRLIASMGITQEQLEEVI